jgi:hypothetical protein
MSRALLAVALVCTVAFDASGVVFALLGREMIVRLRETMRPAAVSVWLQQPGEE